MNDRELLQMALNVLEECYDVQAYPANGETIQDDAIKALRARLAQPEPEPVANLWECLGRWSAMIAHDGEHADLSPPSWLCDAIQVATAPPKHEWVGLTEEDIDDAEIHLTSCRNNHESWIEGIQEFAKAIEAKLKEKNGV